MKHRHCTGRKRERKGSTDWYRTIEAANLAAVEQAWAAQAAVAHDAPQSPPEVEQILDLPTT